MDFEVTPLSKDNDTNNNVIQPNKPGFMPGRFNFDLNLRFVFIGAASIIAIGILFFFLGKASFGDDKVELRIEGPSEVKGGGLVSFKVIYENKSSVDLKGVKLVFTYPDNSVVIKDGDVVDIENEFIDIGELKNGKSEEMEFKAYIVGDRGNVKQARASITFTPSNLSSVLKKDVALPMTITSLPVELTLVAPPTATDGQSITYILDYRNQTDGDIKNLRINVKFPDLFGVIKNTPQATIGSTWDIETLKSDEGSRITMLGTIRGNERESKIISATLQRKIETPDGEMYIDFARAEATTAISSP
ncbi:MAG: hypothetical protein Q8Q06_00180, partial [bacterium]|nr:hypothetical protein [bacterium]